MEIFLATQPIFSNSGRVYGYEVLYRSNYENRCLCEDGEKATANVILDCFQTIGLKMLTCGKPAFINFTGQLLKKEIPTLFSAKELVIEIVESTILDDEMLKICQYLQNKGYKIALDDFVFIEGNKRMAELADIIKVDFLNTPLSKIKETTERIKKIRKKQTILLAEKIESHEMLQTAKELGYALFQGYFFSKPVIISAKDLPPLKMNYLQLLGKINEPEINFECVAEIIGRDISLAYKLLKFVNSALFGIKREIKSIKEALIFIGEKNLRKWLSLIILKGAAHDKSDEVIRRSLIRARFGEEVSALIELKCYASDLFLAGLFSMLDVLFNRPMEELLKDLPLSCEVREVLISGTGKFENIFSLVHAWERGEWEKAVAYEKKIGLKEGETMNIFLNSIAWSNQVLQQI